MKKKITKKSAPKFKPGDVVMLACGGPAMTVEKVNDFDNNNVICRWFPSCPGAFDHSGRPFAQGFSQTERFAEATLIACNPLTYGETEKF